MSTLENSGAVTETSEERKSATKEKEKKSETKKRVTALRPMKDK